MINFDFDEMHTSDYTHVNFNCRVCFDKFDWIKEKRKKYKKKQNLAVVVVFLLCLAMCDSHEWIILWRFFPVKCSLETSIYK